MLIEAWLGAVIFVLISVIAILAIVNSMYLDDKLAKANEKIDSLREELCEKELHIAALNRKLLVKSANEIYREMGKK